MASAVALGVLVLVLVNGTGAVIANKLSANSDFDENYYVTWRPDHVSIFDQGGIVQLILDRSSGSGFGSKSLYDSGFFHFDIKVPGGDTSDVITTFYLTTKRKQKNDEVDIEFLGNKLGQPYVLQTNIYLNGEGGREQRIGLWFDPTTNFHSYKILWNPHQIVFYVDDTPIRVFKNETGKGVGYPSEPMQILTSIWNGDWATGGSHINWAYAPFKAQYQDFKVNSCPSSNGRHSSSDCDRWWNGKKYQSLDASEESLLQDVKKKYLTHDYFADKPRYRQPPLNAPSDMNYRQFPITSHS